MRYKKQPPKKPLTEKQKQRKIAERKVHALEREMKRKNKTSTIELVGIPYHCKKQFKMLCIREGTTMKKTIIRFMQGVVIADKRKRYIEQIKDV